MILTDDWGRANEFSVVENINKIRISFSIIKMEKRTFS